MNACFAAAGGGVLFGGASGEGGVVMRAGVQWGDAAGAGRRGARVRSQQ